MFDTEREAFAELPRDRQLTELRDRMKKIEGRVGAVAPAKVSAIDVIAIPGGIGELLPGGGLERGSVVSCRGSAGILAGILAAVTAAGHGAALVGGRHPRIGLLAVYEMGGQLSHLAVIDATGGTPAEVVSVLATGVPVIVLDTPTTVPPAQARTLVSKIRSQRGVLVCTGRVRGIRADVALDAHPAGYSGMGRGFGRLQEIKVAVEVSGRNMRPCRSELLLAASGSRSAWTRTSVETSARGWSRTG